MIVTLKPPDREEYRLTTDGQPVFSSVMRGGYEQAQIDVQLDDEERYHAIGARLRIHGDTGIVWQGVVTRRPGRGEPLVAQGWGWYGTCDRREAVYCATDHEGWVERTYVGRYSDTIRYRNDATALRFTAKGSVDTGHYNGAMRLIPTTSGSYISLSWGRPDTDWTLSLSWGTYAPTTPSGYEPSGGYTGTQTIVAAGGGATTGDFTHTISDTHDLLTLSVQYSGSLATLNEACYFHSIKVYGSGDLTTVSTKNVAADIWSKEISTDALPSGSAYLAWVDAEATTVEPLTFASTTANVKLDELMKHAANTWGWYMERPGGIPYCVPHWYAISTTPDYIVQLDRAESYDLDESSLDELVSVARVHYRDPGGRERTEDVTDTDTTHPLVALGITRYGDLRAQTSYSGNAALIGAQYLDEYGREQVKGSVTTREVLSVTGADVYLPDIRPGRMVRLLGLPDGYRDAVVKRVTCEGDAIATLELDNSPYRLDIFLARIANTQTLEDAMQDRIPYAAFTRGW